MVLTSQHHHLAIAGYFDSPLVSVQTGALAGGVRWVRTQFHLPPPPPPPHGQKKVRLERTYKADKIRIYEKNAIHELFSSDFSLHSSFHVYKTYPLSKQIDVLFSC